MPGVSFTKDGEEPLVFSINPSYPERLETNAGFTLSLTDGGSAYAYGRCRPYVLHTLRFEDMPASDYDGGFDYASGAQMYSTQSLIGWFLRSAPAGTSFVYIDPFTITRTVEFADTRLEFSLTSRGFYSGTVRLREYVGQP